MNTFTHQFDVVWEGRWYRLASFESHQKNKVPGDKYLLLDRLSRPFIVPRADVSIPPKPL